MELHTKLSEIVKKIQEENENIQEFGLDDDLMEKGFNSISVIKLVVEIENEFDIEFNDEDLILDKLNTINKLVHYVSTLIAEM